MGHNDRRRWLTAGDAVERAASGGRTWRVRPVGKGWRLDKIDPAAVGLFGGPVAPAAIPTWDAATKEACIEMVAHIERHEAYANKASKVTGKSTKATQVPGITVHAFRNGTAIHASAVDDKTNRQVGMFRADLSDWKTAWVLGEPTFDGGYSVQAHLIGKGIGLALFEAVDELAGVALTPHGSYGAQGSQSSLSLAFWEKRAKHRRIPGLDDPAVAARDAERLRVRMILAMASTDKSARDPEFIAAMACATGWDVVHVPSKDGSGILEAWCVGPDGLALSGAGPDDGIPTMEGDTSEGEAPRTVRTDAATYLASIETIMLDMQGRPGLTGEHRSYAAQLSHAAATVLDRYAGVSVSPTDLKAAILAPGDGMLHTAILRAGAGPTEAGGSVDEPVEPAGPRP